VVSHLPEFEGKKLQSVAQGDLDLSKLPGGTEEKKDSTTDDESLKPLLEAMQKALAEQVKDVRVSHRLTESPACLVSEEGAISGHLERLLKAAGQSVPVVKPILEINPSHPLLERLKGLQDETKLQEWSQLLFEQSLLAEGGTLQDPAGFVKRLNQLMLG
jgi:molecular chaperone HtpG